MDKRTIYFWLIFIASIILSGIIISIFVKTVKVVLMAIFVLALAPIVFFILKSLLMPSKKDGTDKLKKRD